MVLFTAFTITDIVIIIVVNINIVYAFYSIFLEFIHAMKSPRGKNDERTCRNGHEYMEHSHNYN